MPVRSPPLFRRASTLARNRLAKMRLLPLPRGESDRFSLQNHAALTALAARQGSAASLQQLLDMIILTGFIDEARSRELNPETLATAGHAIEAAHSRGTSSGEWYLDDEARDLCAALVSWHDKQLASVPRYVLEEAVERVDRTRLMSSL